MAITENALISPGTRVRIRRGAYPIDAAMLGRTGVVVDASPYRAHAYGVVLDGEGEPRIFSPDELERIETPTLPPDRRDAKRRRALP